VTVRPFSRFNALPRWIRAPGVLLLGTLGGMLALRIGAPLPWLLGPLLAVAACALLGMEGGVPDQVRKGGQAMAGFCVGLFFTPVVAERVLALGWLMVLGSLCSILASVAMALALARAGKCDRSTAYFAMLPGGLAEMAGFARQFDANVALVSLSQMLRVVIIVITLPSLLLALGTDAGVDSATAGPEMGYGMAAAGVALAAAIAMAMQRLRIFNPWLLGGLAAGIAFGLLLPSSLYAPQLLRIAAQIAIGAALGVRFRRALMRGVHGRFLPATMVATLALIGVNCGLAWLFSAYVPLAAGALATAPGGIAEMSLTAQAMHLSPPLVTAWQLVRILMVALLAGPLYSWYRRVVPAAAPPRPDPR